MKNDDSCGCAMGAKFMVAGLLMGSAYCGWQFFANKLSLSSMVLRIFLGAFLAGGAGKIIGILRYRLRGKRILFLSNGFLIHLFNKKGG